MKTMKFKFWLFQRIKIKEIEWFGTIIGVWIGDSGVQYKVRYIYQGKPEEVYFIEDELEAT